MLIDQVTDAGRRRLISVNHRILTYNKAREFGLPHPSQVRLDRGANRGANHGASGAAAESDVRAMRNVHFSAFVPLIGPLG